MNNGREVIVRGHIFVDTMAVENIMEVNEVLFCQRHSSISVRLDRLFDERKRTFPVYFYSLGMNDKLPLI